MIDLYFVRHGQTDYNARHVIQGQCDRSTCEGVSDIGLNETGREQARALANRMKAQRAAFDVILSSDLLRAMETGVILAEALDLRIVPCTGLREMFFGAAWEGVEVQTFKETKFTPPLVFTDAATGGTLTVPDGETLRAYHKSTEPQYENIAHPGGESKREVADRALAALQAFAAANPSCKRILIPTHNGLMRFLMPAIGIVGHTSCVHALYDPEIQNLALVSKTEGAV